jgi:threonine dehydrogenase-like Zn-dependent dehydrogenase
MPWKCSATFFPTGFECGVLHGKVQPGSTVAIVGAGPIGLATLLMAQFYSPAKIFMIDLDDNRLKMSSRFGATAVINNKDGKAAERVMKMTGGRGVDTAIEAVGVPAFITCEDTSHRVASSRISAFTVSRRTCTWSACEIAISRSRPGWSTP